jgi:hypothetical protein
MVLQDITASAKNTGVKDAWWFGSAGLRYDAAMVQPLPHLSMVPGLAALPFIMIWPFVNLVNHLRLWHCV